jgi:competence ComEA-like helix-hairpin-helix protein
LLPWLIAFVMSGALCAQDQLPGGPAKKTVAAVCGACHDLDTAVGMRRTKEGWQATVDAMVNRGARATDEEINTVLEYLARYFGVVNVNRATAKEIEEVLEISPQVALAIVQYRTQNGDINDLETLQKVRGVDAKLIEERKDRITFK